MFSWFASLALISGYLILYLPKKHLDWAQIVLQYSKNIEATTISNSNKTT
jgi:hypothetical protein